MPNFGRQGRSQASHARRLIQTMYVCACVCADTAWGVLLMHGSKVSSCSSRVTTGSICSTVRENSQTVVCDEPKASFTSSSKVRTKAGRERSYLTLKCSSIRELVDHAILMGL